MTNELEKPPHTIDGFAGYEDAVEGNEQQTSNRVIQGELVKFTNEASWVTGAGEELPSDLELVVIDIGRVVQKWKDGNPVETRVLQPGEKFPDIDALNCAEKRMGRRAGRQTARALAKSACRLSARSTEDGQIHVAHRHSRWRDRCSRYC